MAEGEVKRMVESRPPVYEVLKHTVYVAAEELALGSPVLLEAFRDSRDSPAHLFENAATGIAGSTLVVSKTDRKCWRPSDSSIVIWGT